jgi:ankyrin repeat protein
MNARTQEFLVACEVHSPARLRAVLDAGFDVRAPIDGVKPVTLLIEMYFRSDRFPECLALLLAAGAEPEDPRLIPVLLNDPAMLLHVAAEYGHFAVAESLLTHGATVDARAAVDGDGLNGHTPLFHTVNSNANRSAPVMELLLAHGARTDVLVPGITWGAGFAWATTCFDVTPLSYAQCGNLPQFQRSEGQIAANVRTLLAAAGRSIPRDLNVPNRYLRDG